MQTEILTVHLANPDADSIARAAKILRAGGLVAFPTETVYGLGADALNAAAVAGIFAAKGRPANNPLIVHIAEPAAASALVAAWPDTAARLAERFWPGPLTLVLPRRDIVPDIVTAGGPTVALRIPAHPVAQALIRAVSTPIAAPSANRSTELSPTNAEHVRKGLAGRIDMVLDAGPTSGGLESTVLDLAANPPRLLRPGLVSAKDIEAIIGPIERIVPTAEALRPLPSPGMMARHYAPRTPLECISENAWERVMALCAGGQRIGWLTFAAPGRTLPSGLVIAIMPRDPVAYASRLYAALHELDAAGLNRIIVTVPPDTAEWLAVRDRLGRAAH